MEILDFVDQYQRLLEKKAALEAELKENGRALQEAKDQLSQSMIDQECAKISRSGFVFSLQSKTKYSKKENCDQELFELLRNEGLGDIIRETVNAQTLQGTVSSLVEECGELPEEWADVINTYDFYDVLRRKETSKAVLAAKSK